MFRTEFKVKGEDVDDYMVMQEFAYHSYIVLAFKKFLSKKKDSKQKSRILKINIQESNEPLTYQKNLMFTQHFYVNLEPIYFNHKERILYAQHRFFNAANELCAFGITKLNWFDQDRQECIIPPKKMMNQILDNPLYTSPSRRQSII